MRQKGFTLIELAVCIAVIAIIAAFAIPNLLKARMHSNEENVIRLLERLATGELKFQKEIRVDVDENAVGEYGTLGELLRLTPMRGSGEFLDDPVFAGGRIEFDPVNQIVQKNGYMISLYLMDAADGREYAAPRFTDGRTRSSSDHFAIYAWPIVQDNTGERCFRVTEEGIVEAIDGADLKGLVTEAKNWITVER